MNSRHVESAPSFQLIAERFLTEISTGIEREIKVQIGCPHVEPDGAWFCPYKISGAGIEHSRYAAGIDSVQTLQLVQIMIGATLAYYSRSLKLKLQLNGEMGTGFPESASLTS